jgi:outer membrane protein OmpA-like peptidoglycan-associated protein
MRRKWVYIGGGAAALVVAGVAATQLTTGTAEQATAPEAAPPPAIAAAVPPSAATAPEKTPERTAETTASVEAAIARLTAALAVQEAENARLRSTLAVRDAVLATLKATVAERDAALDGLRRDLAASNARVATLQASVDAAVSEPASFEAAIAALKPAGEPSAARLEAARAELTDLDAVFAAKASLGAPVALAPMAVAPAVVPGTLSGQPTVQVQFDFASAALTPGGVAHAAAAAVSLRGMTLERVRLVGHTDTVGSPAANRRLADRRARAVAAALIAAGVPAALIEIDGRGEVGLPVATRDGVAEPLNRTVAIVAVPRATS